MNRLSLGLLSLFLVGVASAPSQAATLYSLDSGGLTATYIFSNTLGEIFDVRGTTPAGLTVGVTQDATPLGTAVIGESGPPFGNTTLFALSGFDFIQLDLVPGSAVFSGPSLTLSFAGSTGLPISTPALFPLLGTNEFTFGLTFFGNLDPETVIATYELRGISGPIAPVPEPATAGLLLGGLTLVAAGVRRKKFQA